MKSDQVNKVIKQIEKHMKVLENEAGRIGDTLSKLEELRDTANAAWELLSEAVGELENLK